MRIRLRRFSWWLASGVILLVVVSLVVIGLGPQRPATNGELTFLVRDAENGAPMPGVTVYLYPKPKSLSRRLLAWLTVQQQVTGPDGRVKFAKPAEGAYSAHVAESPAYRDVPPLPGYRPPAGVNGVFFLARKAG